MILLKTKKNISDLTDQELIDAYRTSNDMEWVALIVTRYQLNIYGVGLNYLKSRDDAKDLVIEIFELLTKELLDPDRKYSNFKSWLFVVTKNLCLMKIRKTTTESNKMDLFLSGENMESASYVHYFDEADENESLNEKLKACIERLKHEQKVCIDLFYFRKKTYQEIALAQNFPEKKVKSFIQNGKRNLKICLEGK